MPRQATFKDRKGVQFSLDKQAREQLADLVRVIGVSASEIVRGLIATEHAVIFEATQEHNHDGELGELTQ